MLLCLGVRVARQDFNQCLAVGQHAPPTPRFLYSLEKMQEYRALHADVWPPLGCLILHAVAWCVCVCVCPLPDPSVLDSCRCSRSLLFVAAVGFLTMHDGRVGF